MTEEKIEQAIENFFDWSWGTELIVCAIASIVLFLVGWHLLMNEKNTAGWICIGTGLVVLVSDIFRLCLQLFYKFRKAGIY